MLGDLIITGSFFVGEQKRSAGLGALNPSHCKGDYMNIIQNQQATNHRSFLREFHQILSGKRSLARSAFNNLKPGQKRLLLEAAGIKPRTTTIYNTDSQFLHTFEMRYDDLTDKEIDDLKKGLRRLQSIIDAFALCEEQDFKKEVRKAA